MILLISQINSKLSFNCNTSKASSGEFQETKYSVDDSAVICMHFLPYGVKSAFEIQVDKHSLLSIRRGYEAFSGFDNDFTLQMENSEYFTNLIVS